MVEEVLEANADQYCRESNPGGYISLAVAENALPYENLIKPRLVEAHNVLADYLLEPVASKFSVNATQQEQQQSGGGVTPFYDDMKGHPQVRKVVAAVLDGALLPAGHMETETSFTFKPANVAICSGSSSALDLLSWILADEGDACLIPSPYYAAFQQDLMVRSNVKIFDVPQLINKEMKITSQALDKAYAEALEQGSKPRILLITNPNNPLGTCYKEDELRMLLVWARKHLLHVVSDELYAYTEHSRGESDPSFKSMAQVALEVQREKQSETEEDIEPNLMLGDDIHILYGLSKDFVLSGYRVGFIYSENESVQLALGGLGHFGLPGTATQHIIAELLKDVSWIKRYVDSNNKLVRQACKVTTERLTKLGVPFVRPTSALFVLADFSEFMQSASWDAETQFFKDLFHGARVLLVPGKECHCPSPGWFRICYTAVEAHCLTTALDRIEAFLSAKYSRNTNS